MKSRHLTIRICGRLLKIEIQILDSLSEFGESKPWGNVNGLAGRQLSGWKWCARVPLPLPFTHSIPFFWSPRRQSRGGWLAWPCCLKTAQFFPGCWAELGQGPKKTCVRSKAIALSREVGMSGPGQRAPPLGLNCSLSPLAAHSSNSCTFGGSSSREPTCAVADPVVLSHATSSSPPGASGLEIAS